MNTSDFDFSLPPELIAQQPAGRRDGSRLMAVDRRLGNWRHLAFPAITELLRPGDLLVINDTRVIPARVRGYKPGTGGGVELFFLEETESGDWTVLLRSRRRPVPGDRIAVGDLGPVVTLVADGKDGRAVVRLDPGLSAHDLMARHGRVPLPPYIQRDKERDPRDAEDNGRYQTVYAREPGAVAAPTAGLHFTEELLRLLETRGIRRAAVTLHVGIGTFRPVTAERIDDHTMEAERYEIAPATAAAIAATRAAGGRIVAVGSTSVRTLENAVAEDGTVRAGAGRCSLFIRPGHVFRAVDAIVTNFHLPKSTLLMMMSAFAGRELMLQAYDEAIRERYRFFSYGDAMFIA